jgi:hypothetical protein
MTVDREELDAWMRERNLTLISNEHFADLTRQLALARHSATVNHTEADQLRTQLAEHQHCSCEDQERTYIELADEFDRVGADLDNLRAAAEAVCVEWQEQWPRAVDKDTMVRLAEAIGPAAPAEPKETGGQ